MRRVEAEDTRLELHQARTVDRAREPLRVGHDVAPRGIRPRVLTRSIGMTPRFWRVDQLDLDETVRQRHRGLDRVGQPLAQLALHHQPVDDDRDVVLELLVERDLLVEPAQLAVDLGPGEPLAAELLELLAVLALAAPDDRRQHHEASALWQLHDLVDDLLGRLATDRPAADVAVGMPDPRPQQAQVVVDLGDRADRRPWIARGRLLIDRDRRRQALDRIDVGLVHLPQELARVRRQRFDVSALSLGVDRVERERRLARPRQPRDHGQGVPRDRDRYVFEVVLPGSRDDEFVHITESNRPNRRSRGWRVAVCGNRVRIAGSRSGTVPQPSTELYTSSSSPRRSVSLKFSARYRSVSSRGVPFSAMLSAIRRAPSSSPPLVRT